VAGGVVLGVGVDAVEVNRLRGLLDRRPRLAERLFTPGERTAVTARRDPVPGLAARFAAKEAVMKALGVGLGAFAFHDVEVAEGEGGAPSLVLGAAATRLAAERGIEGWHVSLTHTASVAVAVVVAWG
jgi:holo-[acyl-carrier protein] synthase